MARRVLRTLLDEDAQRVVNAIALRPRHIVGSALGLPVGVHEATSLPYLNAASAVLAWRQTASFIHGDGSDGRSDCHDDLSDLSD